MFQLLGLIAIIASVVIAWKWGGRDERFAAGIFLAATIASRIADQGNFAHIQSTVFIIDFALFAALLILALRSDRFWPMWAAAFQAVGTMVHIASMTETGDFAWAYAVGLIFWSYPVVFALMAGTWLEGRYRSR